MELDELSRAFNGLAAAAADKAKEARRAGEAERKRYERVRAALKDSLGVEER
jgi:hypothetical protein